MDGVSQFFDSTSESLSWLDNTYFDGFFSHLHVKIINRPDAIYLYLASILLLAMVVELVVRARGRKEDREQQAKQQQEVRFAQHVHEIQGGAQGQEPSENEMRELRAEIDGVEDEVVEEEMEMEVDIEVKMEDSVASIASVTEFESAEIATLPSSDRPTGTSSTAILDDSFDELMASLSADAQSLDAKFTDMKRELAMDAAKAKELEKFVISSSNNGSQVTLNEEVQGVEAREPEPATPDKSWSIKNLSIGRVRSMSVDNPWTQPSQTSFTFSKSSQEELEQVIGLSALKGFDYDLPAEARSPFGLQSPSKQSSEEQLTPRRLRARSEMPSQLDTSPMKMSPYTAGLMSPVRANGGYLRMSPSPLRSSPLAMLARTWSDKIQERADEL